MNSVPNNLTPAHVPTMDERRMRVIYDIGRASGVTLRHSLLKYPKVLKIVLDDDVLEFVEKVVDYALIASCRFSSGQADCFISRWLVDLIDLIDVKQNIIDLIDICQTIVSMVGIVDDFTYDHCLFKTSVQRFGTADRFISFVKAATGNHLHMTYIERLSVQYIGYLDESIFFLE